MTERDPRLDELRAAWGRLQTPEPAEALEDADDATRAAVEWMQSAYATLAPRQTARPRFARRGIRPLRRAAGWAAAAAVLALGCGLWWSSAGRVGPMHSEPRDLVQAPPIRPERPPQPVLASASSDRMEFRSGPVRLTLLLEPGTSPAPPTPSEREQKGS